MPLKPDLLKTLNERNQPPEMLQDLGSFALHGLTDEYQTIMDGSYSEFFTLEGLQVYKNAFERSGQLFDRIALAVPTSQRFEEAGVNFITLAMQYAGMKANGLRPEVVVAPILEKEDMQILYEDLSRDGDIPNNPFRTSRSEECLMFSEELGEKEWLLFDNPGSLNTFIADDGVCWKIRNIQGTHESIKGMTHQSLALNYDLPSISEYLTLQALRIQAGEAPLDDYTWTWLHAKSDADLAPCASWSSFLGLMLIDMKSTNKTFANTGCRRVSA